MQETVGIDPSDTYHTLREKLITKSSTMLRDLLFNGDKDRQLVEQKSELVSKAPKLDSSFSLVKLQDVSNYSADQLYHRFRALKGSSLKSLKFSIQGKVVIVDECIRIKDLDIRCFDNQEDIDTLASISRISRPGQLRSIGRVKQFKNKLAVRAADGWLLISRLHTEQGQLTSSKEYMRQVDVYNSDVYID